MSRVAIIGAGQMGSALSFPLRDNGHEVFLVGTPLDREIILRLREDRFHLHLKRFLPEGCRYCFFEEMAEAVSQADFVISGVSSFGVDWFAEEVLPRLPESMPVLSVTKGLVYQGEGRLENYLDYYRERFPDRQLNLNAIGGPCTAYELADRDPSMVAFCGKDMQQLRFFRECMRTSYYHITLTQDVMGLETAVALKNAYALGVALAIGMAEAREGKEGVLHYNSQAALFMQGVKEMRRLLSAAGVSEDNIVFGAGDLYVTVYGGRTRKIGILLGRGIPFEEAVASLQGVTLESLVIAGRAASAVRDRISAGSLSASDFPLLLHIDDIIRRGAGVRIPWEAFEEEILL